MLNNTATKSLSPSKRTHLIFWVCNLSGWLLFYTAQGLTFPGFQKWSPPDRALVMLINVVWILSLTGAYHYFFQWLHLEKRRLRVIFIQGAIASIIIWLLDLALRVYVNDYLYSVFNVVSSRGYSSFSVTMEELSKTNKAAADYIYGTYNYGQLMKFCAIVIWAGIYNAYYFVVQIKNVTIEKLSVTNQLKDAELENLREQLSPHFLFNALNTIHALTEFDPAKASEATLLLSDLMRYTLNYDKRDVVPLKDELHMVRNYLLLEQIRFGDKLQFTINAGDDTLDKQVPIVMIQTLAENALKHGVRKHKGGMVTIKTAMVNGYLHIQIINPGQLRQDLTGYTGIGIINSQQRLQLLFGENATVQLHNKNKTEVEVLVSIPA